MTNDFELNVLVNNGTGKISVKWGVNIIVVSCILRYLSKHTLIRTLVFLSLAKYRF